MDTEGSQMLNFLSAGSEGIAEMRKQARDLGLVISGDTIMSLSEFGNQVNELQRQFEVARTEIAAAFLPVLQDLLIPLIQNTVVPWLQNAANAVKDWADQFVETGEAGDEFRAQVAAWLDPLVRFGRLVNGVVKLLGAVAQGAMSAAASLGAGLGTFIAQLEQMRPIIDEFTKISQLPVMSPQYLMGMGRLLSNLSSADITIDGSAIRESMEEAGRIYHNAAQNLANEGIMSLGEALVGDSFTLELADTVREGVTRGTNEGLAGADSDIPGLTSGAAAAARTIADVITDMLNAIGVAGQRAAHNVAVGMDESTAEAIRLGEELTVVTQAYNTLLAGDFDASDTLLIELRQQAEDLQTALDNLPGPATATAWTARLQLELELGIKEPQEVIDILTPRLQELIAERDELLQGEGYNTQAFVALTADIDALTKAVDDAYSRIPEVVERTIEAFQRIEFPQPDEGEGGENLLPYSVERHAAEVERAARITEAAQEAELKRLEELRFMYEQSQNAMRGRYIAAAAMPSLFTREDALEIEKQVQGYRQVVLAMQAVDDANREAAASAERVQRLIREFLAEPLAPIDEGQGSDLQDVWLAHRDAMQLAEAQALALGESFDLNAAQATALQTTITALLRAGVDPLSVGVQNLVADLDELGDAAEDAGEGLAAGVVEGVRGARDALMEFVGEAPGQFDDFRDALDKLSEDDWPALAAAIGITTEQLEWFLENAETLIAALERTEAFNTLAGQVGGLGGALLSVAADMNTALTEFVVTGERLPLVTASFNAATDAVEAFKGAFADGFDAEELLSGIIGIGSGIAAAIGGPAMGEAFAAIGGFVQSILGDLSNGLKQIKEQVDGIASSSRYASRELVQAFADMNSSLESRGGLAGLFGGKKAVIDEVEVKRLTGIAESVAGGLASAFGAVDLTEFRQKFDVGIDKVIQDQIVAGFMDRSFTQDMLKNITLALDSGDYKGAREEYERLQRSAEATYQQMQQWNRELGITRDYTSDIEAAVRATEDLLASTAASQLERAFATGAMGLQEYAAALAALSDSDVTRDFTRQMDDLKAVRDEALAEGADPAYIHALDEQIRALSGSWREALEQGTYEAAEAIKQILGTSIGDVQGLFRSAFDSSTFDDFLGSFGNNLLMTTRNALITAFLEGAVIKPLMDELSNAITDAVIDGMITEAELKGILAIGDEITGEMEWFFDLLEELGLGFDALTDDVNAATAAMSNVPTVWKGALAEWNAATPATQSLPNGAPGELRMPVENRYEIIFEGPVYGIDDFEKKVVRAVDLSNDQRNLRRTGV